MDPSDLGENEGNAGRATSDVSNLNEGSQRPFGQNSQPPSAASNSPPPPAIASDYTFVDQPHEVRALSPPQSQLKEATPPQPKEVTPPPAPLQRFWVQTSDGPQYVSLPVFPVQGEELQSNAFPLNIEHAPVHLSSEGMYHIDSGSGYATHGEATQSTGPNRGAQTPGTSSTLQQSGNPRVRERRKLRNPITFDRDAKLSPISFGREKNENAATCQNHPSNRII